MWDGRGLIKRSSARKIKNNNARPGDGFEDEEVAKARAFALPLQLYLVVEAAACSILISVNAFATREGHSSELVHIAESGQILDYGGEI